MEHDLSRFAINQITTKSWNMPDAIEGYRRQGVSGIAVWRDKMYEYGVKRTARHLRDAGMWVPTFCATAWMNQVDEDKFRSTLEENKRVLCDAAEVGAPNVVFVTGGPPQGTKDLHGFRSKMHDAIGELIGTARDVGIKIGIEPIHPMYAGDRHVINTMRQTNDLIDEFGDILGIVADVYHCWWDPEFENELRRAGPDRILTFHYCDWLVPTRSWFDRGMVGDGIIDIARYKRLLDEIGYKGPFELEIFSDLDWWKRDPDETVRIGIERCAPFVGAIAK
ncbi:Xylose isomerase domain protein TIM barrel (plasmid) [Rhizobium leguminosarum bv. trifolii WSM2304]|uniref:Xylose isomerase domain protein TIM barrel n=1 Tax=Rhizobium leguminosarum bv. trifolii (strain WSM2304) TaxID=395492 RepID=A0ABF7QZH1_RHILW|nr:sugar phosphate isomerase/epimerase family protein [Rhizobium leguminosarum]ACI59635.1 Xylose isomerase domain protein TIM barrel [Rhizobium leguminosarum bv. trifolii WSM2304]